MDGGYGWGGGGGWGGGWGAFDSGDFDGGNRYGNAYGDYSGGYPMGPMGPPRGFRPPPPGYDHHPLGFGPIGPPPFPPRPPPPMFGRRVRPEQGPHPFEERAMRYLIKCGLSKDFVKKIPKEILPMMEPTHCGLCSYDFNSFALSRIHYNSKGHLSAQKKWIQQRSNMGPAKYKEMPLKARELYCELCDVQITSKVHGESHYAGKPHRAIVEGRKVPKNPMLLQEGAEKRLEQLIRREKKALSKSGEAETPGEEGAEPKAAEPPKPIVPELYCEICKTAVTCSEQMTMHMNGKKHLSKEKQHILKMMKGESADDGNDFGGEDEEYEEEYNEETDVKEGEPGANGGESAANNEEFGASEAGLGANGQPTGVNGADLPLNFSEDNHEWGAGDKVESKWE